MQINDEIIYWDNAATTRVDQRVVDAMLPYFTHFYGNASSNHQFGKIAKEAIEQARTQVANLINSDEKEIIFTSGATESINMALKGYIEANNMKGNHIITVKTEHKAVLSTCEYLEERGVEVTYLDVDKNGLILLDELQNSIKPNTLLISVMYVNNEIGVIQPIRQIGEIAKKHSIAFFCDATQAIGKINVDVEEDNIDMLSFSGHKINGPKGVGVLFKKKHIKITPLIHGGSQEAGLRAGTYNTPLIVGIGKACDLIQNDFELTSKQLNEISELFSKKLNALNGVHLLITSSNRVANILNVHIEGLDANLFIKELSIATISSGSACNSSIMTSSHVLKALGLSDEIILSCVRISVDNTLKLNEIEGFCNQISKHDLS